ncbi:hypothetical protein BDV95DRAFT_590566 [Massariosphaeria phaeospora]|uniref:FAD/NAD(P)-binding domain-containing protein n=1 Tax=Massariosphaeria phaeospora TaxID=100035 RepID=A0A7C8IKF6_9PLEO|nr:hypothetical protein BDV95DRAFT_590566 [Massariosphaeria phaeospora]
MVPDNLYLIAKILVYILPYSLTLLRQRFSAFRHRHVYTALPASETKNVVVIGGSFAGVQIVKRLSETLPTGYRVVLLEKNSHLNYLFAFPRLAVARGLENWGFIPYKGITEGAPRGVFEHIKGEALEVTDGEVVLRNRERIGYEYLVVATGTSSSLPSKVTSTEREAARQELRGMQDRIADAKRIAVVGGGAVGVELVGDIKSFYPEKEVSLIHSRDSLLNSFGRELHKHVMQVFEEMGVAVLLNERPSIPEAGGTLRLLDGRELEFDLIIPCTGQRPNSAILSSLSSSSISKATSRILVQPTLQLADASLPHIFAFGDVAETGGPKMARAAFIQSEVVLQNILAMIKGQKSLKQYKPYALFEGSIKLTLGKSG